MKGNDASRLELVSSLLELPDSLAPVLERLAEFPWDFGGVGVQLKRGHMEGALKRYLSGHLTRERLEEWANAIEGREDIEFVDRHGELLADVLHELANPTLTQPLTTRRATELLGCLTTDL